MLLLNGEAVARALPMVDCITAMEKALDGLANGTYWQPPRQQIRLDGGLSLMGALLQQLERGITNAVERVI
jgi:ornithine cyclodeaminase/alanine dehydrogenase-like protein (mu-crystallin family)